jgi:hypothetical protein
MPKFVIDMSDADALRSMFIEWSEKLKAIEEAPDNAALIADLKKEVDRCAYDSAFKVGL